MRTSARGQLRLCFVTTSLDIGGAESALAAIVERLSAEGQCVQVIALQGAGRLVRDLGQLGVPITILGVRTFPDAIRGLWKAAQLAWRQKPHIVQGWMYHGNLFSCAIAMICRAQLVWGVRQSLAALDREAALTNRLIRICARLSRWPMAIIYASRSARRDHESLGYASERGAVISNGVDVDRFRRDLAARTRWRSRMGVSSSTPLVGIVARLHPIKDHFTFLRAAAIVASEQPLALFALAGRGCNEANQDLMRLLAEFRLRDRVRVLGEVDDVPGLMSSLDVLCLSSRSEAFPNVLAEGMACEVPCVSTDVGDVADILGDTGAVVSVGDAAALAAAIQHLLQLPLDERDELGRTARRRVLERFSLQASAANYLALYRACLGRS